MNPQFAADTGKGQSAVVEPLRLIDLLCGQGSQFHLDASSLEVPGDGLPIDAELCRQLIDGGARAVAIDQASEFRPVEALSPCRCPSRAPMGDQ